MNNDDAYWMGFHIIEVLADYDLCNAFENGLRNSASTRPLTEIERRLLEFIKKLDDLTSSPF